MKPPMSLSAIRRHDLLDFVEYTSLDPRERHLSVDLQGSPWLFPDGTRTHTYSLSPHESISQFNQRVNQSLNTLILDNGRRAIIDPTEGPTNVNI